MTDAIKRQMRRRAAVEPVIGHLKDDHRMDRNHLAGASGDAVHVVRPPSDTTSDASSPGSGFGCPLSGSPSPALAHQDA